jgi:hypothetical protein
MLKNLLCIHKKLEVIWNIGRRLEHCRTDFSQDSNLDLDRRSLGVPRRSVVAAWRRGSSQWESSLTLFSLARKVRPRRWRATPDLHLQPPTRNINLSLTSLHRHQITSVTPHFIFRVPCTIVTRSALLWTIASPVYCRQLQS